MAVYEDYDGVFFTTQALRYYHQDVNRERIKFLVVDNSPESIHSPHIKEFVEDTVKGKYIAAGDAKGNAAAKDLVFKHAETELVLCIDSHVLIEPGGIRALIAYYDNNPESHDLIQGPLLYDDIYSNNVFSHFRPEWGSGMYGKWEADDRAKNKNAPAFEIEAQGCGLMSCRKDAWPGFNSRFKGFAVEEYYIHQKFRNAGHKCVCLPALRWIHRFTRPDGPKYRNVWEERLRNYIIGWREVGLPLKEIVEHFNGILGEEKVKNVLVNLIQEMRE
jgi:hypothetical protein